MSFHNYKLNTTLLNNILKLNFTKPTKVQSLVFEPIIDGKDIVTVAQTGSGKTAAFAIPIINEIIKVNHTGIKCVIIVPTRDLVNQIYETFENLCNNLDIKLCKVMGAMSKQMQIDLLKTHPDIVIAVMGRFRQLFDKKVIDLKYLKYLILDEFDKMLQMGFRNDILALIHFLKEKNRKYQSLFFSATYGKELEHIVNQCMKTNYEVIQTSEETTIKDLIEQTFLLMDKSHMIAELLNIIYHHKEQFIIFTNTIDEAINLENLLRYLGLSVKSIHGNRTQIYRDTIIKQFKNKEISILIATDVLSRGIDIKDINYVLNYNLPEANETYIHRIGRVGRAQNKGKVISICDLTKQNKIDSIIEEYHLHAKIVSKPEWKHKAKKSVRDVINDYYNKFN